MPRDLSKLTTDELLLLLPNQDEEEAGQIVAELIARNRLVAYRSAIRHCRGNVAMADDVFQETFIRLFRWLNHEHARLLPGTFERMLAAFVKRTAIDLMRREMRHVDFGGGQGLTNIPVPGSDTGDWEAREDLGRILANLPERSRSIIQMMLGGMSVTDVAKALDMSEVNVRVSRHRALVAMRAQLVPADKKGEEL